MKATMRIVRGEPNEHTVRERDGEKGGYQIKNKRSDRVTIATTHFTATDDPAGFAIDNNLLPTTNINPSFFLFFVSMAHKCHPADGWIDQLTYI